MLCFKSSVYHTEQSQKVIEVGSAFDMMDPLPRNLSVVYVDI